MSLHVGIGFSDDVDVEKAASDAAYNAKIANEQNEISFTFIFASIEYDFSKITPIVSSILDNQHIIGSSTSGIILSDSIKTRGIAILAITTDEVVFGPGYVDNIHSKDGRQAGVLLAQDALKNFQQGHQRQAFLFFVDGQLENNSSILLGIQDILGNAFPIIGGGSCDDFRFKKSYQIYQKQSFQNSATGVLLGGQIGIGIGGRHGWRPLGKPRKITKTHGNIIESIDNQRASYIYEDYFGSDSKRLETAKFDNMAILYPLGIFMDRKNEYLLRNVVTVNADGSLICQGEVPENSEVHIMIGNKESCKKASIMAANEAKENLGSGNPRLIIILESMARQKLLGRTAYQEINEIRKILGVNTPVIGMYTHGEIYPFLDTKNIKKIHIQNESIVILAIR